MGRESNGETAVALGARLHRLHKSRIYAILFPESTLQQTSGPSFPVPPDKGNAGSGNEIGKNAEKGIRVT